ncbi:MAG TPA: chaperone modulator CbpM [Xanthomonadales bacterium]|nr:chaperone modulator CbpM [Xanthomonadales bacterium]
MNTKQALQGEIAGYDSPLTLEQLCRSCSLPREEILLLIEEGIIEPQVKPGEQHVEHWQFHWKSLTRVRTSTRLQQDLGVNLPGAALALELLERIEQLERQLKALQKS